MNATVFALHLNRRFEFSRSAVEAVDLKLAKVTPVRSISPRVALESFSVICAGPAELPLLQETYWVEHHELGNFPLFSVPMHSEGPGPYYQAVFTRPQA
ncbi:MAG: hypothetical protein ACE5Q6_13445 [Dehalococcoidia bacterium]